MPCLNPEIFFDIGKKLIEEGNQENVYKFAFSGLEPLQAMKRIFSSVTSLKLFKTNYEIGWGEKCYKFELKSDKPHSKLLMHQIGDSVKKLRINCKVSYLHQMYQPIIDKILAKKQLNDLSVGPLCNKSFFNGFIFVFSTSLKHVEIPNKLLSPAFRDSLCLESLTVLNSTDYRFAFFCCKTSSLKLMYISDSAFNVVSLNLLVNYPISPALSFVKELTIEHSSKYFWFNQFEQIIEYFASLESINYNITPKPFSFYYLFEADHSYFATRIRFLMEDINSATKVPPKVTCSFFKSNKHRDFPGFTVDKFLYQDFEFDESVKEFQCFRKTIPSGDNESILFEIHFPK